MTAIHTASNIRITSDEFRCRKSQLTLSQRVPPTVLSHPRRNRTLTSNGSDRRSRQLSCDQYTQNRLISPPGQVHAVGYERRNCCPGWNGRPITWTY
jgi:hypothetical protein